MCTKNKVGPVFCERFVCGPDEKCHAVDADTSNGCQTNHSTQKTGIPKDKLENLQHDLLWGVQVIKRKLSKNVEYYQIAREILHALTLILGYKGHEESA